MAARNPARRDRAQSGILTVPTAAVDRAPPKVSLLYDPKVRGIVYRWLLVVIVAFFAYQAATNAIENLQRANIASGFGFLSTTAGFRHQPGAHPVQRRRRPPTATPSSSACSTRSSWPRSASCSPRFLGFIVGIARLSKNWIVAKIAMVYVEVDPQHSAAAATPVLVHRGPDAAAAAAASRSTSAPGSSSMRAGCSCRARSVASHAWIVARALLVAGIVGAVAFRLWATTAAGRDRAPISRRAGRRSALVVGLPLATWVAAGARRCQPDHLRPAAARAPSTSRGGMQILPEFVALLRRPRDLHRGVHRRSRPGRHPRGVARVRRRRPAPSACGRDRPCASSSFRRPCG